jgi:hypothetical protein
LTFLAALHGGVTVDGLPAAFVPLGMTLAVAAIAWRAGSGLAAAADGLAEHRLRPLVGAGAVQALTFATLSGAAAHFATLGTSSVSPVAATLAGFLLFTATGGVAYVRSSPLAAEVVDLLPDWTGRAVRAAVAGVAVYVGAGALLVSGSLVLHHAQVETLSQRVGGGWSGVPILLLGVLAVPNAVIAGASYLAGPGFAVGLGSGVSFSSTVHGTLPAFPVLGAVPSGPATTPVWLLAAVTPFVAGWCAARAASDGEQSWLLRLRNLGAGVLSAVVIGLVLAWQGGGSIGSGRLSAVGASPWQFGLAIGAALAVIAGLSLAALAALEWWRARTPDPAHSLRARLVAVVTSRAAEQDDDADDAEEENVLAG